MRGGAIMKFRNFLHALLCSAFGLMSETTLAQEQKPSGAREAGSIKGQALNTQDVGNDERPRNATESTEPSRYRADLAEEGGRLLAGNGSQSGN